MKPSEYAVFVVDDDLRMREALFNLLSSMGFHVVVCSSAAEYLQFPKADLPTCLILDVRLPGIDGFELQARLSDQGAPSIVFITGYGDIPSSVKAIKAGAVDFLPKPFNPDRLVAAVREALTRDTERRATQAEMAVLKERFALLTPREGQVMVWLVAGYLNKQAAAELGISEVTVQIHRGQIMRKMQAGSLAELVRMASKLEISLPVDQVSSHMKT